MGNCAYCKEPISHVFCKLFWWCDPDVYYYQRSSDGSCGLMWYPELRRFPNILNLIAFVKAGKLLG